MHPYFYFVLIIASAIFVIAIVFFAHYRKSGHTELYREGVRNENDGRYELALQNYEDALSEIQKLKLDNQFGIKISQRIKVLRNYMLHEKNIQIVRTIDTVEPFAFKITK
jgi:hypothetical protein